MYVYSQNSAVNADDFFAHENKYYPPSISELGKNAKSITIQIYFIVSKITVRHITCRL